MRFILVIFATVLLQGGISYAQDPPAPGPQVPPNRRARMNRSLQMPSSESETPPPAQPNQNGFQPSQARAVGMAVAQAPVQPAQTGGSNAGPGLPGQAATPVPASGEAQGQLNLPPPTPPQVTYRDGQLTVQALNSTLGSVLTAIRNKTGIQFEGLDSGSERVVISMGPAPEGEVLAAILTGSHFDYIAIDRQDSPGIVQRVILTPRTGGSTAPVAGGPPSASSGEEEEAADDDPDNLRAPQDTPARPPVMQAQPIPPPPPTPPPQQGDAAVKTPEQLYEELKQLQLRQQQQQTQAAPQKVPN